ncbi:hypothetical protein RJ639_003242 [Escallonia herrerae]|uniref:ADP/ATP translocase n=1 Tax=Escallonia herrerae TaxID=1293975 RepID=A0AA89AXG9_9ASTE|nr:hypothetical protein RJ639_003242 [Escallonia herrerae]
MAAFRAPSAHTSHYAYGYYSNARLRYPVNTSFVAANPSPVFIQAPSKKGADGFAIDFLMGAVSAAVSKSDAAPIERAKLLIQNQDEMIKSGQLSDPYKAVGSYKHALGLQITVDYPHHAKGLKVVKKQLVEIFPVHFLRNKTPYSRKR